MTDASTLPARADDGMKAYEARPDPERLMEVVRILEGFIPADAASRDAGLARWLRLLALLDRDIDKRFDPDREPMLTTLPPPSADGAQLPPGVQPEAIADPAARQRYVQATAENRAYAAHYRAQLQLGRVNAQATPLAEAWIRRYYDPRRPDDVQTLRAAFARHVQDPVRLGRLQRLLAPPAPR